MQVHVLTGMYVGVLLCVQRNSISKSFNIYKLILYVMIYFPAYNIIWGKPGDLPLYDYKVSAHP